MYTDTDISYLLLAPILYSVPLENNNAKKRKNNLLNYVFHCSDINKKVAGQKCEEIHD